jgi:hypothetical protein
LLVGLKPFVEGSLGLVLILCGPEGDQRKKLEINTLCVRFGSADEMSVCFSRIARYRLMGTRRPKGVDELCSLNLATQ